MAPAAAATVAPAAAATVAPAAAATVAPATGKTVNIYVKKTNAGISKNDIKSDSPLVTVEDDPSNSTTTIKMSNAIQLKLDPSLGELRDWNVRGHATSGWTAGVPAKLNLGGTGLVVESIIDGQLKTIRRGASPKGFISTSQIALAATTTAPRKPITYILVKGLDQQNFNTFSRTGDRLNNGANICITLTFA
jgi:hypothetical protein